MATATKAPTLTLTDDTLAILKNFATINANLLVQPGSILKTITPGKNLLAKTKVSEEFPVEFGIWDLKQFLGIISTFDSPELEFEDKFVRIREAGGKASDSVKYFYSQPSLLTVAKKEIKMPATVVSFRLRTQVLSDLIDRAAILQVADLAVESDDDGNIVLSVFDHGNPTSNRYSVTVGKNDSDATFQFLFKVENLKLLTGTYDVSIAERAIAHFVNTTIDLQYFVGLESKSSYKSA